MQALSCGMVCSSVKGIEVVLSGIESSGQESGIPGRKGGTQVSFGLVCAAQASKIRPCFRRVLYSK